jgi:hypothetical protein
MSGTGGTWGGYGPGPGIRRHQVVELLAGLDGDPDDPTTWTYQGRALTAEQQAIVRDATDDEWDDAATLAGLDVTLHRGALEQLQRLITRLRNGPFDEDEDA